MEYPSGAPGRKEIGYFAHLNLLNTPPAFMQERAGDGFPREFPGAGGGGGGGAGGPPLPFRPIITSSASKFRIHGLSAPSFLFLFSYLQADAKVGEIVDPSSTLRLSCRAGARNLAEGQDRN